MLTFVPLFLLFGWMLPADSMTIRFNFPLRRTYQDIPLSMYEDSIDDMYFGCDNEMMEKVQTYYLKTEMKFKPFAKAWSSADKCAEKKPSEEDKALTKDHMQAICVYTSNDTYATFNKAVREEKSSYSTKFKFHSLHFLLTSAIQILKSNNHCHTTYRRSHDTFTGLENQIIRFGSFASSSYRDDIFDFGTKTCFKIKTCLGAFLKNYSVYDDEAEVLIPPYETFRVTRKIIGRSESGELEDCDLVYELESAGAVSRMNCKAVYPWVISAPSSRLQERKNLLRSRPKLSDFLITTE
ncbi:erythroblast NAD(P)(+)--arginine ADP-ribosyltransferase-like [Notolabrus celidotus]|uniref:erythroblast NAD(P)(+)--arginine ADP-ribosyltransferase-like n=1 Tax=Notolabrus celidotus TaxID=1203425 RepID=UPI00148FAD00|nr:erythroblast NAD(P)(+)--arginine ADP-ribosyltransferase-like [Notolabrus celidotus]